MVVVGVGDQRRLVKEGSLRLINSLSEEMLDKKTLPEVRVTNKPCQSIQDSCLGTDIDVPAEGLPKLPGVVGERQGTPRKAISASFRSCSIPASGAEEGGKAAVDPRRANLHDRLEGRSVHPLIVHLEIVPFLICALNRSPIVHIPSPPSSAAEMLFCSRTFWYPNDPCQ
jgi:hypothetical protein